MPAPAWRELTLSDGRALAYIERGSPAGTPVIYCHGVPNASVEVNLVLNAKPAARNHEAHEEHEDHEEEFLCNSEITAAGSPRSTLLLNRESACG